MSIENVDSFANTINDSVPYFSIYLGFPVVKSQTTADTSSAPSNLSKYAREYTAQSGLEDVELPESIKAIVKEGNYNVYNVTEVIAPYIASIDVKHAVGGTSHTAHNSKQPKLTGRLSMVYNVSDFPENSGTTDNSVPINPLVFFFGSEISTVRIMIVVGYKYINGKAPGSPLSPETYKLRGRIIDYKNENKDAAAIVKYEIINGQTYNLGIANIDNVVGEDSFIVKPADKIFDGYMEFPNVSGDTNGDQTITFDLVGNYNTIELSREGSDLLSASDYRSSLPKTVGDTEDVLLAKKTAKQYLYVREFLKGHPSEDDARNPSIYPNTTEAIVEALQIFLSDNAHLPDSFNDYKPDRSSEDSYFDIPSNAFVDPNHTSRLESFLRNVAEDDPGVYFVFDYSKLTSELYQLNRYSVVGTDDDIKPPGDQTRVSSKAGGPGVRLPFLYGLWFSFKTKNGHGGYTTKSFLTYLNDVALTFVLDYRFIQEPDVDGKKVYRISFYQKSVRGSTADHDQGILTGEFGLVPLFDLYSMPGTTAIPYLQYGVEVLQYSYSLDTNKRNSTEVKDQNTTNIPVVTSEGVVFLQANKTYIKEYFDSLLKQNPNNDAIQTAIDIIQEGAEAPDDFIRKFSILVNSDPVLKRDLTKPTLGKSGLKLTLYLKWGVPGFKPGMQIYFGIGDSSDDHTRDDIKDALPRFIVNRYVVVSVEHAIKPNDIYAQKLICVR